MADSTNVQKPGYTMSEQTVGKVLIRSLRKMKRVELL